MMMTRRRRRRRRRKKRRLMKRRNPAAVGWILKEEKGEELSNSLSVADTTTQWVISSCDIAI